MMKNQMNIIITSEYFIFYYSKLTEETVWEKPSEYIDIQSVEDVI